ncbi:MAG TPA: FAD-binding protein [Candidatus Limnocylindrales bacterium]|nr:FAD-binding protein [Candidatus Limnocylindrales bacterium]
MPAPETVDADVLVVGSGGAGLMAAWAARMAEPGCSVAIMSKGLVGRSGCSIMAQGINAALGADDAPERHFEDLVRAGDFLSDQDLAWQLVTTAPEVIRFLEAEAGCFFDRDAEGRLELAPFPGQSRPRKVHRGHLTGLEIVSRLREHGARLGWRELVDVRALDLLVGDRGEVRGVVALDIRRGVGLIVRARAVVLAAGGGAAALYRVADGAREKTGDGVALAYRAGLPVRDMEFVQFLSVGLVAPGSRVTGVLLEEALRAAGGYLLNGAGERFMERYDRERMERAPRDVVARACYAEIVAGRGTPNGAVLIDVRHLGADVVETRFADLVSRSRRAGRDLAREPVEIAPAAHIQIGGIDVGPDGETAIEGLFVAGEDAGGVHGATWQGGNGIAESTAFGLLAGRRAAAYTIGAPEPARRPDGAEQARAADVLRAAYAPLARAGGPAAWRLWDELREVMWWRVGLARDRAGLRAAADRIAQLRAEATTVAVAGGAGANPSWQEALDLENGLLVAELVVQSALAREETRGMQVRTDFPARDDAGWLRTVVVRAVGADHAVELRPVEFPRLRPNAPVVVP